VTISRRSEAGFDSKRDNGLPLAGSPDGQGSNCTFDVTHRNDVKSRSYREKDTEPLAAGEEVPPVGTVGTLGGEGPCFSRAYAA
jgi:hypothetical protein